MCIGSDNMNLKETRHKNILENIKSHGNVSVNQLSDELNVAQMTIRRDLQELEHKGLLVRVHGGAISSHDFYNELANEDKKQIKREDKTVIGKKMSTLISEHDTIFIGSGTTNEALFPYIKHMKLDIITNARYIFEQYEPLDNMNVILIGGRYRKPTGTFVGYFANELLSQLHIDKCFIGVNGIYQHYATTANEEEGKANQIVLDQSTHKYLTCDHSKFGTRAFINFYNIHHVDAIITDDLLDDALLKTYQQYTSIL